MGPGVMLAASQISLGSLLLVNHPVEMKTLRTRGQRVRETCEVQDVVINDSQEDYIKIIYVGAIVGRHHRMKKKSQFLLWKCRKFLDRIKGESVGHILGKVEYMN
jgi:hypothetical protein